MTSKIREQAANDAHKLLSQGWRGVLPIDLGTISRVVGVRFQDADLDDDTSGALLKEPDRDPVILINAAHGELRKRFTMAHEIAHFLRTRDDALEYRRVAFRRTVFVNGLTPEEEYADEFAASLLMPEGMVRGLHADGLVDWELANRFGVSRAAMRRRMRELVGSPATFAGFHNQG